MRMASPVPIAIAVLAIMASVSGAAAHPDETGAHSGFHTVAPGGTVDNVTWADAVSPLLAGDVSSSISAAEFGAMSQETRSRLADGTVQISRIIFEPQFGQSHTATVPELDASEWSLIEGAAGDVDAACSRVGIGGAVVDGRMVGSGGVLRAMHEILGVRAGGEVIFAHDALSSTAARMHVIYHPDAAPSVSGTQPNTRACTYVADGNDHVEIGRRSAVTSPAGFPVDRIVLSFGEEIAIRPGATGGIENLGQTHMYTALHPTCSTDVAVSCQLYPVNSGQGVVFGPDPGGELTVTPDATQRPRAVGMGTGNFWGDGVFGIGWTTAGGAGILRANDANTGETAPDGRHIASPLVDWSADPEPHFAVSDGLAPAPAAQFTAGTGDAAGTYTQVFTEAPAGTAATVLDGVQVWRTAADGTRAQVTPTVSALSGSTLTFTATPSLALTDHVEYVGIDDAEGNVAVRPAIESVEQMSSTTTVVTLSVPVSGTTEARQWSVDGGGDEARAIGVASGRAASVTPDTSSAGDRDVSVSLQSRITLAHAAIPEASSVTVRYAPPAAHASHADRFADRLAASGVRLEAQTRAEAGFTASTAGTTSIAVTFPAAASGSTAAREWIVGGSLTPESITVGSAIAVTGSVTLTSVREITLNLPASGALADSASTTTLVYTRPTAGPTPNSITVGTDILESTPAAAPVPVADGIRPTVLSASFVDSRTIDVMFDEAVTTRGTWSVSPALGTVTAMDGATPETIRLSTEREATTGLYTITVPAGVSDTAVVPNGADLAAYPTVGTSYRTAGTTLGFGLTFAGPRTLVLAPSDPLDPGTVTIANFAVTAPDGTVLPDDDDSGDDPVALADSNPVMYGHGPPPTVIIRLGIDMVNAVAYTVTPSALVADVTGAAYSGGGVSVTYATGGRMVADGGRTDLNTWEGVPFDSQVRSTFSLLASDAEFAAIDDPTRRRLAEGTAQISRVLFSPHFGEHATVGPALDAAEWTFVEGEDNAVDASSCTRVDGRGTTRDVIEIIAVRSGAPVLLVHDALSSTSARVHAIYHPDSEPSIPGTVPGSRGCDYLNDGNNHVSVDTRSATTSAAGYPADRITLVFSEPVTFRGTAGARASTTEVTFDLDCRMTATTCDIQTAPGIASGPVQGRSFTLTPHSSVRATLANGGTDAFWAPDGRFGVSWAHGNIGVGIKRNDNLADVLSGRIVQDVLDGLSPAPNAALTGTGTPDDPYVQAFSETPDGTVSTVLDGVRIYRTDTGGTRTEVSATATAVGSSSLSFVSGDDIEATDHVEYVGIRDAAGNLSTRPVIESITRIQDTVTIVTFNDSISGATTSRQWLVGAGTELPTAHASGVSAGRHFAVPADGGRSKAILFEKSVTISHAAVAPASTLTVQYSPPDHTSYANRLDDRLAFSGVRVEGQVVRDVAPDTTVPTIESATLNSPTQVTAIMSESVRGTVRGAEWNVGGVTFGSGTASGRIITLRLDPESAPFPTAVAAGTRLAYTGGGSITDTSAELNALAGGASAPLTDGAAPTLASGAAVDALYMRARHSGTTTDTTDPVSAGGELRVYVRASEPLVTAASDISFHADGEPAASVVAVSGLGANAHVYSRTVTESETNGPVAFSLTIRDAGGNMRMLTEDDLTTDRGVGSGHRTTVDTVRPDASAGFTGNAITITFSEPVYGVPDMLEVRSPDGMLEDMSHNHNGGDVAVRIEIDGTPATGTWTVNIPDSVRDAARNVRAVTSSSVTAERGAAPTATLAYTVFESDGTTQRAAPYTNHARAGDVIRLSLTLSEAVNTAPTVVFVGKVDDPTTPLVDESGRANMVNVSGTNEWRAAYTVETAMQNSNLVDGAFTFTATVMGNTGATATLTPASHTSMIPPVIDRMPPTASATFTGADTIAIMLSDAPVGTRSQIEGHAYDVTVPDGTVTPDDADSLPDAVALATADATATPPIMPVSYDAASRTITLTLAADAPAGVVHTITLPPELTDVAGHAVADRTLEATSEAAPDPPEATSLVFTVLTGSPLAAKTGANSNLAGIDDTVRITLNLDVDVATAPRITLDGRGTTSVAMGNAGDADASTWSHDYAVDESHDSATVADPLDILIVATGASASVARITATAGLASGTLVMLPLIDAERPMATALTAAVVLAGQSADAAAGTVAAIGDSVLVRLTADEELVTAATDIVFFGRAGANADAVTPGASNLYTYARTILDTDANGPLAFSLTMSDIAGNTATLTQGDLTATNVTVDSDAPTVTAMSHSDTARTITLTFSEGLVASTAVAANFEVRGFTESTQMRSSSALTLNAAHGTAGVDYTAGASTSETSTVSIGLNEDDSYDAYKVIIAAAVTDTATNAYVPIENPDNDPATDDSDITVQKRDTVPPMATGISVTVHDGAATVAAKTGAAAGFAGIDDTIRLDITLNEDASGTPTIDIAGTTGASMDDRADGDATTWRYDLTVSSTTDETAELDFTIMVTDGDNPGTITATTGHVGTLTFNRPAIDRTAPAASSLTTTVRLEGATADSPTVTLAGIDDVVRVNVAASEPLVTAVGDIALFGTSTAADSVDSGASNAYSYVRTIVDADDNGPLAFSLTMSDRAGNTATLTQADVDGTNVTVDADAPTIMSAITASTTTLTVTLSEAVTGTSDAGHWSAIDTDPAVTAAISAADVSGSTVTLTYTAIEDTSFSPEVTYTAPSSGAPADAARNALGGGPVTADDGINPTAEAAFVANSIVITFSEPVDNVMPTLSVRPPTGSAVLRAVEHTDGTNTATIRITDSTIETGTWRVTIPARVTDASDNARATATVDAMRTDAPTATVAYEVQDQSTGTARAAPYQNHARAGDVIRLSLTLSEAVTTAPTVLFVGKTDSPDTTADDANTITMIQEGSTMEWRATYTVENAMQNPDLVDGPFTFVATLRGNTGAEGTATQALATPPTIDRIAPALSAAQTVDLDEVTVSFSEDVSGTTSAMDWAVGGTQAASVAAAGAAQAGDQAIASRGALTLGLSQAGELAGGESRPAVAFTARTTPALLDVAGNPLASGSVMAIDRIRPSLVSMEFTAPNMITVTLSEPLDADTLGTSIPQGSLSPHLGGITVNYAAGAESLTLMTLENAVERSIHSLTLPVRVTDAANAADVSRNAISQAAVAATLPDTTPPTYTARTHSASQVIVTFSEPVEGTTAASEWAVGVPTSPGAAVPTASVVADTPNAGSASATIASSPAFTGPLYVGLAGADTANHWGPADTPDVRFTMPSNGLTDVAAPGDTANALETTATVTASDGIAPTAALAVFVTPTEVHVTFSEDVTIEEGGVWTVSGLGVTDVMAGSLGNIVELTVDPPAVEGEAHTVGVARASVRDGGENTLAADVNIAGVTYMSTVMFTASTFRAASGEYVRVVLDDSTAGTTVAGEWFIGVAADGTGGAAAASLSAVCTADTDPAVQASINMADICPGAAESEANTIYLAYVAPDSGATPRVAYRAPSGDGATPIVSALNMLGISDRAVVAVDGLAPLLTAAKTASSRTLTVAFDEDVAAAEGGIDASRWHHYDSAATPPTSAELDAAVNAGTAFASAALDGRTLTLTLPGSYAPSAGWGSADTSAVPQTIGYRVPAGESPDITDVSPAANGLADGTARRGVSDGAPPEATTIMAVVVEDSDGDGVFMPKVGANARIAGIGDAVSATVMLAEASSTTSLPTFMALGTTQAMVLSGGGTTATASIAVPDSWTRDGPLEFTITAHDMASPANTAMFTQDDLVGDGIIVDVSAPTIESVLLISPSSAQFTFSEEIIGAGSVSVSPDAGTGSPAAVTLHADGTLATAGLVLAGRTYTFTIEATLTDRAGNTFAAQDIQVDADGSFVSDVLVVPDSPNCAGDGLFVTTGGDSIRLVLDNVGADGIICPDITMSIQGRMTMYIRAGTVVSSFGPDLGRTLEMSITSRLDSAGLAGTLTGEIPEYVAAAGRDADAVAANEMAASAIRASEPAILAVLGKADASAPMLFSQNSVSIRLHGAANSVHAFYIDGSGLADVHSIPTCADEGYIEAGAAAPPSLGDAAVASDAAECRVDDRDDIVIWTNHFTLFGASAQGTSTGGSGCSDCTPPTLGVDSTGTRRVDGGFSYNNDRINVEYYYTPMPLITVETGEENVAQMVIFEDSGAHNTRHVGLGFGLSRGQHFAESQAEIRVDMPRDHDAMVSLDDPASAIDADSLRVSDDLVECMAGSRSVCKLITIRHTFREPLEFSMVSTIVWDDRRNSWQNFFNHGIHVIGESLNPQHGIPVNDGSLILYPLISSDRDTDGDGLYDYDIRHVTYMLDDEQHVYRLGPDGEYHPLRNLSLIHHAGIEEPLHGNIEHLPHGPARGTAGFWEAVEGERHAAANRLAAAYPGLAMHGDGSVDGLPDRGTLLEGVHEAIADEINAAELGARAARVP